MNIAILKKKDGWEWTDEELGYVALELNALVYRHTEKPECLIVPDRYSEEQLQQMLGDVEIER